MKLAATYRWAILYIVSLVISSTAIGQWPAKKQLKEATDSILISQVNQGKIPGAVVFIKKGNKTSIKRAYGYAQKYDFEHRLLSKPEVMTKRHLFDLASLTKVIGTTTSIMLLVDRGLIDVDDSVGKYIPAFDSLGKKEITIRHLLTHTAGLYEWYPMYYRASSKQQSFKLIDTLPLKYPVGAGRHYSDLGFVLLGEIIEKVSGLALNDFMTKNIFLPLKMKKTRYLPLQSGKYKKIASTSAGNPYEYRMVHDTTLGMTINYIDPDSWSGWRKYILKGEVNDGNAWYANEGVSGAAGLFSTMDDVQKLVDVLLHQGKHAGFISNKTIQTFLTPDSFNNGLGWMMDTTASFMKNTPQGSFGHTGFTGTSIVVLPKKKISVILLINRQQTGLSNSGTYFNVNPIRQEILNAVLKDLK